MFTQPIAARCRHGILPPHVPCSGRRYSSLSLAALFAALVALSSLTPDYALAQSTSEMRQRMEVLEQEMKTLKEQMGRAVNRAQVAERKASAVQRKVEADSNTTVKWHLAGYASVGAIATDDDATDDTFLAGKFNPVFHFQYKDIVLFESELEIEAEEDGSTNVTLEYASIDLLLHDNVTLVAGKFLSPIGQFQERLHPAWINKMPDAPAGFGHGGIQPASDVGVMLRGGINLDPMIINYSFFTGNGPQVEYSDGDLKSIELEGFGSDDNGDKAFGGRIGFLPLPSLEVGGSFMMSKMEGRKETGVTGATSEGDFTLWGLDASYTKGPWNVRVEYLSAQLDSFLSQMEAADASTDIVPSSSWKAWYAQVAYRLSGLTKADILKNVELVARYGEFDADGFDEFVEHAAPEERLSLGVNYYFAPTLIGKLAVSARDFADADTNDRAEVRAQIAYGF